MIKTKLILFLPAAVLSFFIFGFAKASTDRLPAVMVGQSSLLQDVNNDLTRSYGGFSGNEAIVNFNKDILIEFAKEALTGSGKCYDYIFGANPCFSFGSGHANGLAILSAKTAVSSGQGEAKKTVLETAVLFYRPKIVMGDTYNGANDDFWKNFYSRGKNLAVSPSNIVENVSGKSAVWNISGYRLGGKSESAPGGDKLVKNEQKINLMAKEAPAITAVANFSAAGSWYLQSENILNSEQGEAAINPEGKAWVVNGDLKLSGTRTYYGQGTIFVRGNLIIDNNSDIRPNPSAPDKNHLGFIVLAKENHTDCDAAGGNLTMNGNGKLRAAVYVCGNFAAAGGGNADFYGSFAARTFSIDSANTRFYYDSHLSGSWPPGFRYLNMPGMEEK